MIWSWILPLFLVICPPCPLPPLPLPSTPPFHPLPLPSSPSPHLKKWIGGCAEFRKRFCKHANSRWTRLAILYSTRHSTNVDRFSEVLLHNGRDCNGWITKRICSYKLSHHKNKYYIKEDKKNYIFLLLSSRRSVANLDTVVLFLNYAKHRSVIQPLQNLPFCSSTFSEGGQKAPVLGPVFKTLTVYVLYNIFPDINTAEKLYTPSGRSE